LDEVDLFPIIADFGEAQQEFHIGMRSMVTPGAVKGLFQVHKDLGSMPMARLIEPAVKLALDGVRINQLQHYIFTIVEKIYISKENCLKAYGAPDQPDKLVSEGGLFVMPAFADTLAALVHEGEDLFSRGEIAAKLAADCLHGGGYLGRDDLEAYRLKKAHRCT
jgi:gamma-glutamyltranspeptidase/glutathione hydrolase